MPWWRGTQTRLSIPSESRRGAALLFQISGLQSPKSNYLIFEVDLIWQARRRRRRFLAAFVSEHSLGIDVGITWEYGNRAAFPGYLLTTAAALLDGNWRELSASEGRSTPVTPVPAGQALHPKPVVAQGFRALFVALCLGDHADTLQLTHRSAIAGTVKLNAQTVWRRGGDGAGHHGAEDHTEPGEKEHSAQPLHAHLTELKHLPILPRNGSSRSTSPFRDPDAPADSRSCYVSARRLADRSLCGTSSAGRWNV